MIFRAKRRGALQPEVTRQWRGPGREHRELRQGAEGVPGAMAVAGGALSAWNNSLMRCPSNPPAEQRSPVTPIPSYPPLPWGSTLTRWPMYPSVAVGTQVTLRPTCPTVPGDGPVAGGLRVARRIDVIILSTWDFKTCSRDC
jgi:hypothetical protein